MIKVFLAACLLFLGVLTTLAEPALISVRIEWATPTEPTCFRIFEELRPGEWREIKESPVSEPGVRLLRPLGCHIFAVSAVSSDGIESRRSNPLSVQFK